MHCEYVGWNVDKYELCLVGTIVLLDEIDFIYLEFFN